MYPSSYFKLHENLGGFLLPGAMSKTGFAIAFGAAMKACERGSQWELACQAIFDVLNGHEVEKKEAYLEDHPSGCKWLITMVIVSPIRIGLI